MTRLLKHVEITVLSVPSPPREGGVKFYKGEEE